MSKADNLASLLNSSGLLDSDDIATDAITAAKLNIGQIGGRRNLIINGAMQVAQRGTSESGITASGYYTADRFQVVLNSLGTWTQTQVSDAPDGFANSLKMDCTTEETSPAPGSYITLTQLIEGQDLQHLGFGSSSAQPLTLSFWVKSNKTGTATVELQQKDNSDKQVTPSYTINAANTWEHKVINIPADTSGLINDDNGAGLWVFFWLNSGADFTGGTNRTTWTAEANADRNASNLGIGGSTDDEFYITGVQLEVGDTATPFEHRSYGEELALCQRYYQIGNITARESAHTSNAQMLVNAPFATQMRATPTMTTTDEGSVNLGSPTAYPDYTNFQIGANHTTNDSYMNVNWTAKAEL